MVHLPINRITHVDIIANLKKWEANMPVRILRENDVRSLVGMAEALEAVETAFLEQSNGTGINEPRRRVRQPNGTLHTMSGALVARRYWGLKAYTATRQTVRFIVHLYDTQSGAFLAMIEADYLGQLRTGAASGVATRHLARHDAGTLALFGSGFQAEAQLEAVAAVRPLRDVRVYSRSEERRTAFAHKMGSQLGLSVRAVESPGAAINGADVIITVTTASDPVFNGEDLHNGVHINAAGSNSAARAEIDRTTIRRADRIFTDDLETARLESGDLIRAFERNAFHWGQVRPLADVITGLTPGRRRPDEITLFESQGVALWDIALAAIVYERAVAADIGTMLNFAE